MINKGHVSHLRSKINAQFMHLSYANQKQEKSQRRVIVSTSLSFADVQTKGEY